MARAALTLRTAFSDAPPLKPLLDGAVQPAGASLDREQVNIVAAFRSMCRSLNYDLCEMAVVTYFAARWYGIAMTAIPVFPLSNLVGRPGAFTVNTRSGVETPKDLEGRRVAVRSYTLTPGTWARSVLQEHAGVDLEKVTWVVNDEEHVEQYHKDTPANVDRRVGADLGKMLVDGEIEAAIMVRADSPDVKPAFADVQARAADAFRRAGITPVDHTVVVKTALLEEHPWLARAVYDAMKESKAEWRRRTPDAPPADDLLNDPMPMGMSATRKTLAKLMQLSVEQHILPKALDIDELFPGGLD